VHGPLDFALTGILAAITAPLAAAGIPAFAVSAARFHPSWDEMKGMERGPAPIPGAGPFSICNLLQMISLKLLRA
jgi:hypothetical protein